MRARNEQARAYLRLLLLGLVVTSGAAAGCSDRLETGYEPRRLGATPTERRGYYAPPFTPEAAAASQQNRDDDTRSLRRPTMYR